MNKSLITAALAATLALGALATPVMAAGLSIGEVIREVRGMNLVSGSIRNGNAVFESNKDSIIVETVHHDPIITPNDPIQNPDIVTTKEVLVSPASSGRDHNTKGVGNSGKAEWCPKISVMYPKTPGGKTFPSGVNKDCVPELLYDTDSARSAVIRVDTTRTAVDPTPVPDTVTPVADTTVDVPAVETTTKVLSYSRSTGLTIDTSVSTKPKT